MSEDSDQDMATLAVDASETSRPFHHRRKSWARRIERCCYLTLSYFPLTFVYGLTTWAVWVEAQVSFFGGTTSLSYFTAGLGILLYALANISYTIAVFTPPGSPLDSGSTKRGRSGKYESLPTHEEHETPEHDMSMVTAKASGKKRYCKKCKVTKPDRTHHCSTCGKCVMKMDHHCPWLATCVGLRNYKAFLLFLVYTCCFCWTCFGVSITWTLNHVLEQVILDDGWRLVNTILLAVLGGIIGLVLSGFTGWHIYLTVTGATTIESLEKTRYLNPLRRSLQQDPRRNYLSQDGGHEQQSLTNQLKEMHANALPGVLRPEEGESEVLPTPATALSSGNSPARASLQRSYASLEAQRDQERYEAYLDEQDSEKMPNAFDLGWKRNLLHVLGPSPLFWALPVCNTTGDGWKWEVSDKWMVARDEIARGRARQQREDSRWNSHNPLNYQQRRTQDLKWTPGQGFVSQGPPRAPPHDANGLNSMPLQSLDSAQAVHTNSSHINRNDGSTSNWNDVPDEFLDRSHSRNQRDRSHGRAKGD